MLLPQPGREQERKQQPGQVEGSDDRQVRGGMRTGDLLPHDDEDIRKHHPGVEDGRDADPFPAAQEGIDRHDIERSIEEHIQPDGLLPPLRAGHQERVIGGAVGMDDLQHDRRRPGRLAVLDRVRDDQLLQVNDVRDEKEIDDEKDHEQPVQAALAEGDGGAIHCDASVDIGLVVSHTCLAGHFP